MALPDSSTTESVEQVTKLGYDDIQSILDFVAESSHTLAQEIDSAHAHCGRTGYPATSMLQVYALQFLLAEQHANKFLAIVNNDPRLLKILGLKKAPSESTYSNFKNWKLADRIPQLNAIIAGAVEECHLRIERLRRIGIVSQDAPRLGENLAIDKTDVEAYANPKLKLCVDPDATWGHRTVKNRSPKASKGKAAKRQPESEGAGEDSATERTESYLGYGVHTIVDSYWGIPLYMKTRPANEHESRHFKTDLEAMVKMHPGLKPLNIAADKGYDSQRNYDAAASLKIHLVSPLVNLPRDKKTKQRRLHLGIYTNDGLPTCIGGKPMTFLGTDSEGDHWFTCDWEGCHLKHKIDWSRYCDFEHSEKPEGKVLRIMGSIHRSSREWNRLYNMRPVIERYFSSGKRSRLLDTHKCLNLERVTLHVTMSWMAYALTLLCHLKAGDPDNMLHMPIELTPD